jgi:hypothetical protein
LIPPAAVILPNELGPPSAPNPPLPTFTTIEESKAYEESYTTCPPPPPPPPELPSE